MLGSELPQRMQLYNKRSGYVKKEGWHSGRKAAKGDYGTKTKKMVANTHSIWYYTFCD